MACVTISHNRIYYSRHNQNGSSGPAQSRVGSQRGDCICRHCIGGRPRSYSTRAPRSQECRRHHFLSRRTAYWDGSIEQDIPTSELAEMLSWHSFNAAQYNPQLFPFFYNSRGGVGRPTPWPSSSKKTVTSTTTTEQDAWRGCFLLSTLELYLKNDMKVKFQFVHDIEAALGFNNLWVLPRLLCHKFPLLIARN